MWIRKCAVLAATIWLVGAARSSDDRLQRPRTLSAYDGWRGVTIARGKTCPRCCSLVFPDAFGLRNPGELALLRGIMAPRAVRNDLDCYAMPNRDAMDHLLHLAIDRQDRGAAELILDGEQPGGIRLGGGELSERYGPDYLIPALRGYSGVAELLTRDREERIAGIVCQSGEIHGTEVGAVVAGLERKKAFSLAKEISRRCRPLAGSQKGARGTQ